MSDKLKTLSCVATIGCIFFLFFVFLLVLAPVSASAAENTVWTKYNNDIPGATNTTSTDGRIPLGTNGKGDDSFAYDPWVIKDGSTYKMWYAGYDGTTAFRIYYATSPDGLTWTKYDNTLPGATNTTSSNGRIPLGTTGRGDDTHVREPCVIKDGATYKMWYSEYNAGGYRIYYATSTNGLDWTKYDNTLPGATNTTSSNGRVPLGTNGKGDDKSVSAPSVIKDGSTYKMWYTGYDSAKMYIFYATSSNGLDWTKYDNSIPTASNTTGTNGRIPLGTSGGDTIRAFESMVIKDGSIYKQWYTGHDGTNFRIYYATSPDGLTWTKYDNSVPDPSDTTSTNGRIPLGTSGKGDFRYSAYPCVIKDRYTYKMWYTGYESTSSSTGRIYHATSEQPPPRTIFKFR